MAGLFLRRGWRLSFFFTPYVLAVLIAEILITSWPLRFWTWEFWVTKQAIHDALKLGFVMEVGWRTFRPFPGAEAVLRRWALLVLGVTAVCLLASPLPDFRDGWATTHLGRLHPIIFSGTIWVGCLTLALAHWYRLPVHPFYSGVIVSLVAYMAIFGGLLTFLGRNGPNATRAAFLWIDRPAFLVVCWWWAYLAWRLDGRAAAEYLAGLSRLREATHLAGREWRGTSVPPA